MWGFTPVWASFLCFVGRWSRLTLLYCVRVLYAISKTAENYKYPAMSALKSDMIRDSVALDVPEYLHLLTGHYVVRGSRYYARRPQGTDDWLLTSTLSGQGRFGPGSDPLIVGARDLVLIRPGTSHDYGVLPDAGRWELLWTHFHPRPHWHEWLAWPEHTPGLMRLTLTDDAAWKEARTCFRRAHQYAADAEPYGQDRAMNSLEGVLLCCQNTLSQSQEALDERIRSILRTINGRLSDDLDIAFLASAVALSPSRFAHLFREQVGISPIQYLDLQRIQRAKQLLERTTGSIAQIAEEVGLDPVYFSLRFKQHVGHSPSAYRNCKTISGTPPGRSK
jgi:AraC family transcriptional regulator of arabinose operon